MDSWVWGGNFGQLCQWEVGKLGNQDFGKSEIRVWEGKSKGFALQCEFTESKSLKQVYVAPTVGNRPQA